MRVQNNAPGLLSSTVTLAAAQMKVLSSTPAPLVLGAGAGRIVVVESVALVANVLTRPFQSSTTDQLNLFYALDLATGLTPAIFDFFSLNASSIVYLSGAIQNSAVLQSSAVNQAIVLKSAADYTAGAIATATIAAAGTGYAVGDTGSITPSFKGATYIITSVGALGAVTGFTITSGGDQYDIANGVATATGGAQPGVGTGLTVNITAITAGDGTLKVVTYYQIVPVP